MLEGVIVILGEPKATEGLAELAAARAEAATLAGLATGIAEEAALARGRISATTTGIPVTS